MMRRLHLWVLLPLLCMCACVAAPSALVPGVAKGGAPPALAERLKTLAVGFDGRVGVAVEAIGGDWVADYDGAALYPQQSVSKLWVAMTVFNAVDEGRLSLSKPVLVTRDDMSVFHQPIQTRLGPSGFVTTIDGLLSLALAQSDNAANDILVRQVGGPIQVQSALNGHGLALIRSGPPERVLQSTIAGVVWKPDYSFGQAFWDARDQVPMPVRRADLYAYLSDPDDGASPDAIVDGLTRLVRGQLMSKTSTAHFLSILAGTETGPLRLKAGLAHGWMIAHKTGTGQDLGELSTGYNDVGILWSPSGRAYAVAVMIAQTHAGIPARQDVMANVARAVVEADADVGPAGTGRNADGP